MSSPKECSQFVRPFHTARLLNLLFCWCVAVINDRPIHCHHSSYRFFLFIHHDFSNSHCSVKWVENRWMLTIVFHFRSFRFLLVVLFFPFIPMEFVMIINHKFICIIVEMTDNTKKFIRNLSNAQKNVKLNKVQAENCITLHNLLHLLFSAFFNSLEMLIFYLFYSELNWEIVEWLWFFSEYLERCVIEVLLLTFDSTYLHQQQ